MVDFTVTEETVSKLYVEINESKIPLGLTIDFLNEVKGATSFNPLRWTTEYSVVAEPLIEVEVISKTNSGSWYVKDEKARAELYEALINTYDEQN